MFACNVSLFVALLVGHFRLKSEHGQGSLFLSAGEGQYFVKRRNSRLTKIAETPHMLNKVSRRGRGEVEESNNRVYLHSV